MYYSRIGRHLACKMATLLALMFAACSNDTTPSTVAHDGGYTEETAFLENIIRSANVITRQNVAPIKSRNSMF